MGFSALDGLVMGTRCGSIDPGVLLYLLEQGWDHDRIQALLYRQSGLLGVSGIAADMRTLRASTAPAAQFAIELFTRRVVRATGELSACIGGLDVLAFSGGIGENDSLLRADVAQRLAYLGVRVDATLNARPAHGHAAWAIHAPDSAVEVWVVPTDEGRVAAAEAAALVL
jgi:acetate kinase